MCVWFWYLAARRHSWPGFVANVCGLGFFLYPAIFGWGVGACGLLRALNPCPATTWWGCLWPGVVWGSPWARFLPPPVLFFLLPGCGGGLLVRFSALLRCGFVVVAVACPGL